MRKTVFALSAALLIAGCAKDDGFAVDSAENLVEVTFNAGTSSDSETKVSAGWEGSNNLLYWSSSDAIGIFAGDDNVNRRFVLSSEPDQRSGSFTGQMMPVSSPVTLTAYYPYSESATLSKIPYPDLTNQEFEGTFDEHGEFTNYGKYAMLRGWIYNFTVDKKWPEGTSVSFRPIGGLVRFAISYEFDSPINVRAVGLTSNYRSFVKITYINPSSAGIWGYYTGKISTKISDKNPLVINKNETKYVQMASTYSNFSYGEQIEAFVDVINADGRNIRYTVPKTVSSSLNLDYGKRASVSIPINDGGGCSMSAANRVKITTDAAVTSLLAPTIAHDANYTAADTWWGDSSVEPFESGRLHTFTTPGAHSSSFNYWGESGKVYIESLKGVTAVDFSNFN